MAIYRQIGVINDFAISTPTLTAMLGGSVWRQCAPVCWPMLSNLYRSARSRMRAMMPLVEMPS